MNGKNHQDNKVANRNLILKLISLHAPISRIALSKQTGLSKMSLTNIIHEFLEEGIVFEIGQVATAIGRHPILLDIVPASLHGAGLYISRDYIKGCIADLKGNIKKSIEIALGPYENSNSLCDKAIQITHELLVDDCTWPIGLGISAIGPIDSVAGMILAPPNFYGLHNIPIVQALLHHFDLPIFLENDMNTSALAEKYYGHAKNMKNFVYLGVTNGIGAGIVADGNLYRGDMGFGGEIGHTSIYFDGPPCSCGNKGCLELYASIPVIVSMAKSAISGGKVTMLTSLEEIDYAAICRCAGRGDALCIELLEHLCRFLCVGMVSMINLFDPQAVFLGHDIAIGGSLILSALQRQLQSSTISAGYKNTPILISKFEDVSPLIGSVSLVFDRLLFSSDLPEKLHKFKPHYRQK